MRGWLCAACVLLCVMLFGTRVDGQQYGSGTVEVGGALARAAGQDGYDLRVRFTAQAETPVAEALLVYAEPSRVLLLAHQIQGASRENGFFADALGSGMGDSSNFGYNLRLPYNPEFLGDNAIRVVLVSKGKEYLVAAGRINSTHFNVTTSFDVAYGPDGSIEAVTGLQHCCGGGGRCGRMCITCDGAYFTCDRINCTIECGWL